MGIFFLSDFNTKILRELILHLKNKSMTVLQSQYKIISKLLLRYLGFKDKLVQST